MPAKHQTSKIVLATLMLCTWVGGLAFIGHEVFQEATQAGAVGQVPTLWPLTAQLTHRSLAKPTLVVAIHPKCGCSTATVAELSKLLNDFPNRLAVQVLVRQPQDTTWTRSSRETTLSSLPDVTLIQDHGGLEAARFGALTSGQLILFNTNGREVFAGGLTALRGHEGPNEGRTAIAAYLTSGEIPLAASAVFGCALADIHPRGDSLLAEAKP